MRHIYTFLYYLMLPFVFLRLVKRAWHAPAYIKQWPQRFGFFDSKERIEKSIWIHAVSLGEVIAAQPLIDLLKKNQPELTIVVTTMTATGAARVQTIPDVQHFYLPYDVPFALKRLLAHINPKIVAIMETELWPNLLYICHRHHIPICLLNARLSNQSAKRYAFIRRFTQQMLQKINLIGAQGHRDQLRFLELGAMQHQISITGNLKFDIELPRDLKVKAQRLRNDLGNGRFIWVAASTHEGEDEIVLAAHAKLLQVAPEALLILVPRHPERFLQAYVLSQKGFRAARHSEHTQGVSSLEVYIGDTIGELLLFYAVADVAMVCGSLVPRGGHNMLEAAVLEKPILTGPHLHNFKEIYELLLSANGIMQVENGLHLSQVLIDLYHHPKQRQTLGENAAQVLLANKGALTRQYAIVAKLLKQSDGSHSF